jgi:methylenetetrahydrofolate dehydrogenase (NADP+)/methenyltetrahydrofolate cyclohydrolase
LAAVVLDGKALAGEILHEVAEKVAALATAGGPVPCLAAILVGNDPASEIYVRNKERACRRCGMHSRLVRPGESVGFADVHAIIEALNRDARVHGILLQLPLPAGLSAGPLLDAIDPAKDVDAFHPENVGLLVQGRPRFVPCTPGGILQLLVRNNVQTAGRHVVVVGRSDTVGKPLANLLLQRGPAGDATVTVCHSRTPDLGAVTRTADILVAAVGRPRLVTADMVRPGAVVIDVGINRTAEGLAGDVDFEGVSKVASMITPVPGGVGPLTVAMLIRNTLDAAQSPLKKGTGTSP